MTACPACAVECPEGSRFCPSCGAALGVSAPHAVERKVVTTMFCDLVDFTGLCEAADSEDVDRLLREFYALARNAIEAVGGSVEKFVGDAVVGIFGVPVAHEDDAEQAVRTALRLRDRLADLPRIAGWNPQVRIGINTGLAVVRLDVQPGSGAGLLVGDAVNTAARLQQLAPPMGIVVGQTTQELSARTIEYTRLDPAIVKGKRAAVKCWLVRGPVSRMGVDLRRRFAAPLVGREVELGILRGLLKKVRASSQPQFALLVGEPGIGKSRLLFELLRYIDSRPFIVRWRQGRCPAYGDGLTFWALGEIVKEQLGVVERDEVAVVEAKLAHALADTEDREWLAARLRPLLGLESPVASREENFAAWQRFLELIAADAPAVLVVEDLQWASEGTLAFLRHLMEHVGQVPLLAIGTTRPGLFQARPDIAARLAEAAFSQRGRLIDLGPLSASETEELVSRVGPGLGELRETRQVIAGRCAGNPLFAEQLVRLLEEESSTGTEVTADVALKERAAQALPESLQSLIAARLDDLPASHKALLGDAAVVGEVFWAGAVAALDHGDREAAEEGLNDLVRHELLRHERDSSMVGEDEFVFRHGLIRDVAYAQLTRADRAAKHAAVAHWLEATAGGRVDEVAEILAHHYVIALELARATGDDRLQGELLQPTIGSLKLAGDRTLPLVVSSAEQYYGRAAALAQGSDPSRPGILVGWSRALHQAGRSVEAKEKVEEAVDILRGMGEPRALAMALSTRARICGWLGDPSSDRLHDEALRICEREGPSPELLGVLEAWVGDRAAAMDYEAALAGAAKAVRLGKQLGLAPSPSIIHWQGQIRCALGDERGLSGMRRSLRQARKRGLGHEASRFAYNYAQELLWYRGPRAALAAVNDGLQCAREQGDVTACGYLTLAELQCLWLLGDWQSLRARAAGLDGVLDEQRDMVDLILLRGLVGMVLLAEGDRGLSDHAALLAVSQRSDLDPSTRQICLTVSVALQAALHDAQAAGRSLAELERLAQVCGQCDPNVATYLPEAARRVADVASLAAVVGVSSRLRPNRPMDAAAVAGIEALAAEKAGDQARAECKYGEAAMYWGNLGVPYELAYAQFGRARCLASLDRRAEADTLLGTCSDTLTRLGATAALIETQAFRRSWDPRDLGAR